MALALSSLATTSTFVATASIYASSTATIQPLPLINIPKFVSISTLSTRADQWSTSALAIPTSTPSSYITVNVPPLDLRAAPPYRESWRPKKDHTVDWAKAKWLTKATVALCLFDLGSLFLLLWLWAKGWVDARLNFRRSYRRYTFAPTPRQQDHYIRYRQLQRAQRERQRTLERFAELDSIDGEPNPRDIALRDSDRTPLAHADRRRWYLGQRSQQSSFDGFDSSDDVALRRAPPAATTTRGGSTTRPQIPLTRQSWAGEQQRRQHEERRQEQRRGLRLRWLAHELEMLREEGWALRVGTMYEAEAGAEAGAGAGSGRRTGEGDSGAHDREGGRFNGSGRAAEDVGFVDLGRPVLVR